MSKFEIKVVRIVRNANGGAYTGTFHLSDNAALVSTDGGRSLKPSSVTLVGEVDSVAYDGKQIAKIRGTQGASRDTPCVAAAIIGGEIQPVHVVWGAGHRSSVAAAFAALWTEMLTNGAAEIVDRVNPKGSKSSTPVMAVDTALQSKLDQQAAELSELKAMLAALMAKQVVPAEADTVEEVVETKRRR